MLLRSAELARVWLRVLAFARRTLPGGDGEEAAEGESELEFLGLAGMLDPPRPGSLRMQ